MPINLNFRYKGRGGNKTDKTPTTFWYRSLDEKQEALLEFIKNVKEASRYYLSEDPEIGQEYIDNHKYKASIEFLETTASEDMEEALHLAKDALTQKELLDMLLSCVVADPGSSIPHTNALYVVNPLGTLAVDLNQFSGRINAKPVKNLYDALTEGFEQDHLDWVEEQVRALWEGDTLFVDPLSQDSWQAVVDEEAFLAKLEERLEKKKTA